MMRLDAATKQITHAIRRAAGNAETARALARALAGHYARAEDEACTLIREALASCGDIHPGPGLERSTASSEPPHAPKRSNEPSISA